MRDDETLTKELASIRAEAGAYFRETVGLWSKDHANYYTPGETTEFVRSLPELLAGQLADLESRITIWASQFASLAHSSMLLSAADQGDIRICTRKMTAALRFRDYAFYETSLMSWEDRVYGVKPAEQSEQDIAPPQAPGAFASAAAKLEYLLLFLKRDEPQNSVSDRRMPLISGGQQRHDTAFIMMWMSEDHPELTDVKEGITEVFQEFGINAIRADDIEHEGVITERIVQEISSAEFLIADLTGARPECLLRNRLCTRIRETPHPLQEEGHGPSFRSSWAERAELRQCLRFEADAPNPFGSVDGY